MIAEGNRDVDGRGGGGRGVRRSPHAQTFRTKF